MPFQSPQLAKTFDPKKPPKFPVFVEPKLDGLRAYVIPATGQVFSRNGKPFQNFGHIVEQLKSIPEAMNYVFDGEALAVTNDWNESASIARGSNRASDAEKLHFHAFDIIPLKDFEEGRIPVMTQSNRSNLLNKIIGTSLKNIHVPKSVKVDSIEEVMTAGKKFLIDGFEGAMVKNPNGLYKYGKRSNDWMKVKFSLDEDMIIIGVDEGDGKLKGLLGTFIMERSDGTRCRCGIGTNESLNDNARSEYWKMHQRGELIGTVGEFRFERTEKIGVRFPRFLRLRFDKTAEDVRSSNDGAIKIKG